MRRRSAALLVLSAAALAGCGSGGSHFANQPRPPSPVNLTVYINNQRVSISPSTVGAGPVVFIVTNQANQAESLMILPEGQAPPAPTSKTGCPSSSPNQPPASEPLACTGPISPQATAQVTVNLGSGGYTLVTSGSGNEASQAAQVPIQPALLRIGSRRTSSSGQLLIP